MPLRPPALDDRSFDDLVAEVLARIPAHTPEWTNPRPGDPGRTLVDLFAWLTDTLLYRVNRIPERQKLAFLRLLGVPLRPAVAARGLVSLALDDEKSAHAAALRPFASMTGPVPFETRTELTVLPVEAQAYHKRPLGEAEAGEMRDLLEGLEALFTQGEGLLPYVTTPVFAGGAADPAGFDLVRQTVDGSLWLALLAATPELVEAARKTLGGAGDAPQRLLSVGLAPAIEISAWNEEIGERAGIPHVWQLSTGRLVERQAEYLTLEEVADGTGRLTRSGVVRLALPGPDDIGALPNDVRDDMEAGTGDRPPRLDGADQAARLVAWLRLRPTVRVHSLRLSWVGVNAVEIDQRQTLALRVVGQSDGTADQEMRLPAPSVEQETLELEVEEAGAGYRRWWRVDDLATAGREDPVYALDSEAGLVRFGDGVRGRIPELGRRVRVARMRAGGGRAGNLPPGTLANVAAVDLEGRPVARLKVLQPLPTSGGEDAETVEEAERRIPAIFRDRNRAVTEEDYRRVAADSPGVRLGRVEVLPRFKPQQRRSGVPGVVSVMVLPQQEARRAPNPRADRPLLERVHAHLDLRRPLTTELYVIGCEYVPLGLSTRVVIREGFGQDAVLNGVREALRTYLWPLAPGGMEEKGWPLGRAVRDRELEVVVARVPGVAGVAGVNLFQRHDEGWRIVPRPHENAPVELPLLAWQLPELLSVVVEPGEGAVPVDLRGAPNPLLPGPGGEGARVVAVPVVPEIC